MWGDRNLPRFIKGTFKRNSRVKGQEWCESKWFLRKGLGLLLRMLEHNGPGALLWGGCLYASCSQWGSDGAGLRRGETQREEGARRWHRLGLPKDLISVPSIAH